MRIVIAGAHGQIARRLGRLLSAPRRHRRRHRPQPRPRADLRGRRRRAGGARPGVGVASTTSPTARARRRRRRLRRRRRPGQRRRPQGHRRPRRRRPAGRRRGAGRRPPLPARLLDGRRAGADGGAPSGMDEVFVAYLRAKLAAEDEILPRARPGHDGAAAGRPHRRPGHRPGHPRAGGRAAAACRGTTSPRCWSRCWTPAGRRVLEVVGGTTPIAEAVAGCSERQARRARVTAPGRPARSSAG